MLSILHSFRTRSRRATHKDTYSRLTSAISTRQNLTCHAVRSFGSVHKNTNKGIMCVKKRSPFRSGVPCLLPFTTLKLSNIFYTDIVKQYIASRCTILRTFPVLAIRVLPESRRNLNRNTVRRKIFRPTNCSLRTARLL